MAEKKNSIENEKSAEEMQDKVEETILNETEFENEAGEENGKIEEETENDNELKKKKPEVLLEELAEKMAELMDKHLRLQAEFDNFRRRTLKEKAELIKAGGESVLVNILPVIDDFERAIQLLKNVPDTDAGKQGTQLIYAKFVDFLKQNNVKEIEALNQDFDVEHHEAVSTGPAPSKELKGKVIDVIQKGYQLNDKVIRFAKVIIGE